MVRHAINGTTTSNGSTPSASPALSDHRVRSLPQDAKQALVSAVAQELHRIHNGNAVLDWLEAEILVEDVLEGRAKGTADERR